MNKKENAGLDFISRDEIVVEEKEKFVAKYSDKATAEIVITIVDGAKTYVIKHKVNLREFKPNANSQNFGYYIGDKILKDAGIETHGFNVNCVITDTVRKKNF
jgi:hypothetical protein